MSNSTKSDLLDLLAQSFSATQALLDEVDLETVVYENPDWRDNQAECRKYLMTVRPVLGGGGI
jgi:hypothetical protein